MYLLEEDQPLPTWLTQQSLPDYRAAQVFTWIFQQRADSFDQMTNLPKSLRGELAETFTVFSSRIHTHQTSDDGTDKLLLALHDGQRVECVLLRDDRGHRTACLSTQVGCAMGCVFCATGLDGLVRNLSTGEIVEQLLHLQRCLPPDERISHVVVMGMGEPTANLGGLLPALDLAARSDRLGIGARRITISTIGVPEGIRRLAQATHPYHLAVSLHAPDDALRRTLIPTGRKTSIAEILAATDDYFAATGRRVTFEYVLLAGVNDDVEQARRLARLLAGRKALINLIPLNPVAGVPYRTPSPATVARFVEALEVGGANAQVRYRKGDRINAACGQLRRGETRS